MSDIDDRHLPARKPKEILARLFLEVTGESPKTVLDVGCAHGRYVSFYARKTGAQGVGIDVDKDAIEIARKLAEDTSVKFIVADGTDLPSEITERRFDLILLVGSRVSDYGLFSPAKVLENIDSYRALLTEGGRLILKENTDFSGRIESSIGWHYKTSAEIDGLLSRDDEIFFFRGLNYFNPKILAMPIIRSAVSFLTRNFCKFFNRQCSFVIIMRSS